LQPDVLITKKEKHPEPASLRIVRVKRIDRAYGFDSSHHMAVASRIRRTRGAAVANRRLKRSAESFVKAASK
jgi:hypothetical protein